MPKPANMPPAGRAWPFTWFLPGTMSPYNGEPHPSAPFATHNDLFLISNRLSLDVKPNLGQVSGVESIAADSTVLINLVNLD